VIRSFIEFEGQGAVLPLSYSIWWESVAALLTSSGRQRCLVFPKAIVLSKKPPEKDVSEDVLGKQLDIYRPFTKICTTSDQNALGLMKRPKVFDGSSGRHVENGR
jgi:hypothetical protein